MSTNEKKMTTAETHSAKRLARLAAAQALYQFTFDLQSAADIVSDYKAGNFASLAEEQKEILDLGLNDIAPDAELFSAIVSGTALNMAAVDELLAGILSPPLTSARLEPLLRAILRAGLFEVIHHPKIPTGVIVNDYVDVTRAFFNVREPGLVNAVLDKAAQKVRT